MSEVPPHLRREYSHDTLDEGSALPDAMEQFARWFADAGSADVPEPNAMTLATADARGVPSARVVLLKEYGPAGFTFYTNYTSRKGTDLTANPHAAICFYWQPLERQVRAEGRAQAVSRQESEAYFHSRPRSAQIGAWVSHQSRVIDSREELEKREAEVTARFAGGSVPLPEFWGGYRLVPRAVEFWQGRPSRLHDRLLYTRAEPAGQGEAGAWVIRRLAP